MLKRITIGLLVVVAVTLIAFVASAQSESAAPRVGVSIQSRPDFAEVRVDGAFVGTAPMNFRMTPGVHRLEISRSKYDTWSRDLTVVNDNPTSVVALLDASAAKPCK